METRPKAPGLKWRKRAGSIEVPYWISDDGKMAINLSPYGVWSAGRFTADPAFLIQRCERLHDEAQMLAAERSNAKPTFDGTFGALIDIYLKDPESAYRTLKPGSLHPYTIYAKELKRHIGPVLIEDSDGREVKRWFKDWAGVDDLRDPAARLPRARFMLTVLKAAVSFGIVCKIAPCKTFKAVLEELEFPAPKRRKFAPTAEQIVAARAAAHAAGAPGRALLYALQFETTARQWDLIGQWLPLSDIRPSALHHNGLKWIGPTWASIDQHMILRVKPTKTEDTTDVDGTFDLSVCPMVMEELARIPPERRAGPLIVHEATGMPYVHVSFRDCWRRDFKAAGLPAKMWNRDLRAGGSTEGSKAGASREDRAKVAGHSPEMQGKVYDRDTVEAHRRTMAARTGFRAKTNGSGT